MKLIKYRCDVCSAEVSEKDITTNANPWLPLDHVCTKCTTVLRQFVANEIRRHEASEAIQN